MRWSIDARADAMYVTLREGDIARTVETSSGAADIDSDGHVIGIEVLSPASQFDARALTAELSLDEEDANSLAFLQVGLMGRFGLASHVVATEPEAAPAIETATPYVLQDCPA